MLTTTLSAAVLSPALTGVLIRSNSWLASEYSPRRALYMAHPWLLCTNVLSDVLTVLSYALFFIGICWLVRKLKLVPQLNGYLWGFTAFRIFLLASGASVLVRIVNIWFPLYHFSIGLKVLCAATAIPAAILFVWQSQAMAAGMTHFFTLRSDEQQHAEALRKSEEFLDRTNRIAGVGGWEVDLLTGGVSWSEETYRIHGCPLSYKPTLQEGLDFYTPACRPVITAAVNAACDKGDGFDLELSVVRLDGTQIWVRTVGGAEFRDGKPIRLAGAFQDITARVAEREELRQANERVAIATDSGGIGIWDWDITKNVVHCDARMHRLHGMVPGHEAANELRRKEQLHPEDRHTVEQAIEDAVEGRCVYDTEFRTVWADGSVHNIRGTARVTRNQAGEAVRMIGANWDVTEARKLTAELAQQHELLRVTLQSIGDGVITTDARGEVVWLNPVAERMTGWTVADAIGWPLTQIFRIIHEETRLRVKNPVEKCLASRARTNLAPDTVLIAQDGTEFGIEDSAAPIHGTEGELLGAVLVFRDVTEQRRLLAEANRATRDELKLKDDFLSHVSHELRSPLTSIYSFSSIIADNLAGSTTPQQQEFLQIVIKNTGQLQSMIEDLLMVTQAKEGRLSIELQAVSAPDAVLDAVHTMQAQAACKQISLSCTYGDFLCPAYADPTRLRQILIILLDNAVKFTPHGGKINVRVSERDSTSLLLEVSDTGCGIAPEKRERVFENLYQITGSDHSGSSQNGRNGLGLGLHIAKDLVTRQGGRIWISGGPGRGSIFSFTLPTFAGEIDDIVPNTSAAKARLVSQMQGPGERVTLSTQM